MIVGGHVITALFAVVAVLVFATVYVLVRKLDDAVAHREQAVVEHGIAAREGEVAGMVVPQVVWDEAVDHLDHRYDAAWATDNIGQFFRQVDGFEASFVLDAANRPLFASNETGSVDEGYYAEFASLTRPLVSRVRAAETKRGRIRTPAKPGVMVASPIQANTIGIVGGETYLITASLVQPDFGTIMPSGPAAPIVITAKALDRDFLSAFANRFMIADLKLHHGAAAPDGRGALAALRGVDGQVVAVLSWSPQLPGRALMRNVILPMLAVMSALGVTALTLFRFGRRAARDLIASEARASHLAYHDALTGQPNRVKFLDRLSHALDQARRSGGQVAVHAIDLDRFKDVNDTFGHHVGDELIRLAAQRMAAQCRSSDTFARLSGDEFAVVQSNASAASAAALAARLVEVMSESAELSTGRVFVGCSVGVTVIDNGEMDPAEALRQADLALYRAKGDGKSRYCFFEIEMDAAIKTRRLLEADLREALRTDCLQMAYQPQVDRHGEIIGVESLVRWNHPERGAVSPAFFVPIAEECGLISELGVFALRRAFRDSHRWPHLKVAVNVSAPQLRAPDFIDQVTALVAEARVDPRNFELEITEGVLLGDDPATHETLKRLRQMGFALALDDFGTGYSSLSYLRNYPVNKIKIDRSFITNLGVDNQSDAVIAAIVKLARALKLDVIAEGVETSDQRRRLTAAGCNEVQGYLYSRPVPADQIDGLVKLRVLAQSAA